MKSHLWAVALLYATVANAQTYMITVDSLRHQLAATDQDTSRVLIMIALCDSYRSTDSARYFGEQALSLARKINYPKGEIRAMSYLARAYAELGNLPKGFQMALNSLQVAEDTQMEQEAALTYNQIGNLYTYLSDFGKALSFYKRSLAIAEKYNDKAGSSLEKMQLGRAFEELNQLDSALFYEQQAYNEMLQRRKNDLLVNPLVYRNLGRIYSKAGRHSLAIANAIKALTISRNFKFRFGEAFVLTDLGIIYKRMNQQDSAIYYAKMGLAEATQISNRRIILLASQLLSELNESIDTKEAFRYHKMATAIKDSLFGNGNLQAIQQMFVQEQQRKNEVEAQKMAYRNQLRQYGLLAVLGLSLFIGFILYRNYKQQKRVNSLLSRQKEEISRQREKAESALTDLKTTQQQLIQREKMASLGELTAGIAHEIQNPLNFVNNLSEVSTELVEELKEERKKVDRDEELEEELLTDLEETLHKVSHHGKRADAIVKGMLQHSRASSGQKEPTDLNALADEYLRLAYQNLRAKESDFMVDLRLSLDPKLGQVNVAAQDIGRVLLNLYSNAFYAIQEKQTQNQNGYQPVIEVTTHRENGRVELRVKDNGTGIPPEILSKIYQPFFTTKPTGQGTGLGLSLSYDIVTKGHGGEMSVDSQENVFTKFVVTLPIVKPA